MGAEARDIFSRSVKGLDLSAPTAAKPTSSNPPSTPAQITPSGKFDHLMSIWQGRGTTDQLMQAKRGED